VSSPIQEIRLDSSKSMLNRLLILQSYQPSLVIHGDSKSDDVGHMKSALLQLAKGEVANCGHAGTTLRFLALRASRISGVHRLTGSPRLFSRPQDQIQNLLRQVGVKCRIENLIMVIEGEGWKPLQNMIEIDASVSSQFASSVFLNAWNLEQPWSVEISNDLVSESYLNMTLEIVRSAGLNFELKTQADGARVYLLPAHAKIKARSMSAEIDTSSAFAIAALTVARGGRVKILNWPQHSGQADSIFPIILSGMGVLISYSGNDLIVERDVSIPLRSVSIKLTEAPDLFPVLAVLCSLANGQSSLRGAPQLKHKESSRIEKTAELLSLMGVKFETFADGIEIFGSGPAQDRSKRIQFDPDHDHRLAMAAGVARAAGFDIEVVDREVVTKSLPEFWKIAENML
jgi:3-phosphoshikimate 1-carboxyvinyltransferase